VDKVLVSVGDVLVARDALRLVRRGGVVNLFAGLPNDTVLQVDANRVHYEGVVLLGTFGFAPEHFRQAVLALDRRAWRVEGIITRRVSLVDLEDTFADVARYEGIKTVVMLEAGDDEGGDVQQK
jgi:L-iditol 2-dehydrogenase